VTIEEARSLVNRGIWALVIVCVVWASLNLWDRFYKPYRDGEHTLRLIRVDDSVSCVVAFEEAGGDILSMECNWREERHGRRQRGG